MRVLSPPSLFLATSRHYHPHRYLVLLVRTKDGCVHDSIGAPSACAHCCCAHTPTLTVTQTATNTTACCSAGPELPAAICSSLARRYGDAASEAAAASLAGERRAAPPPHPLAAPRMRKPIDNAILAVPAAAPQHPTTTTSLALR